MITLKKVTEEGEQIVAIGNTYKQILDQFLDGMEEDMLAVGVKYELNVNDAIELSGLEAEDIESEEVNPEQKQIGGNKNEE